MVSTSHLAHGLCLLHRYTVQVYLLSQIHLRLIDERVPRGSTQYRGNFPRICVTNNVFPTGLGYKLVLFVHRGRYMNLRYRRERHPPPPPLSVGGARQLPSERLRRLRWTWSSVQIVISVPAPVPERIPPPLPTEAVRQIFSLYHFSCLASPVVSDGSHPHPGAREGPSLYLYPP